MLLDLKEVGGREKLPPMQEGRNNKFAGRLTIRFKMVFTGYGTRLSREQAYHTGRMVNFGIADWLDFNWSFGQIRKFIHCPDDWPLSQVKTGRKSSRELDQCMVTYRNTLLDLNQYMTTPAGASPLVVGF